MKRISTATGLLTLVAMFVLGVFSVGSASAAPFFLWTGPLPGLLLVLSLNQQVFFATPELAVTCGHFGGHGILSNGTAMSIKTAKIVGRYTKCTAAGNAANISTAEFSVNSEGGVGVIEKPIVITVPLINCSIKISNDSKNAHLLVILFENQPTDVVAHVEVGKILSFGSGGLCGEPTIGKQEGTYRGLLLLSVDGGTLRWDP